MEWSLSDAELGPRGMAIAVSGLYNQNHLKIRTNASFPLIDLAEHSGQLAEMLIAPMATRLLSVLVLMYSK